MFGARKGASEGEPGQQDTTNRNEVAAPATPRAPEAANPSPRMPASPQRVIDIPRAAATRRVHAPAELPAQPETRVSSDGARTLRVGKGLSVAGEITSCDVLVVEGKVEAKLNDGKMLEITEAGQFRGSVEIENADIAGRYDGQLIVHGRLTVRSTGRVSGMVKYGELEVNAGGQIIGEIQVIGGTAGAQAPNYNKSGKFAAAYAEETEEQAAARNERRSA